MSWLSKRRGRKHSRSDLRRVILSLKALDESERKKLLLLYAKLLSAEDIEANRKIMLKIDATVSENDLDLFFANLYAERLKFEAANENNLMKDL